LHADIDVRTHFWEKEVDGQQLNNKHSEEQKVKLPASRSNTDWDKVLVEEQTDVGRNVLHQQTIGTNVKGENLERIGDVEGDPADIVSLILLKHG